MSDAKPTETKAAEVAAVPPSSSAKAPEDKPAAAAAPAAAPAPAAAAAPASSSAKAPEDKAAPAAHAPKPAPPPKPAAAASSSAKAPEDKPAAAPAPAPAPAAPSPLSAGLRAPVSRPSEGNVSILITPKAALIIMGGLAVLVVTLVCVSLFLIVRLMDRHPLDHITDQQPHMDGTKPKGGSGPAVAAAKPEAGGAETPTAGGGESASNEPLEAVKIGETFAPGDGKPSTLPGYWPTFRGPKFDNILAEKIQLADKWPASGPPVFWSVDLGEGYAGAAVLKGRVYILDYDQKKKEDALRCLSLEDGKEIWRLSYHVSIKMNHGISRTVPAVTDQFIVTIGPKCHVMCAETETGKFLWGIDLQKDYGTKEPLWYTSQCPIIDGTTAIIAPGGKDVLIMGVDCATGKVLWKTPNPKGWQMSHSSVIPYELAGKKMYLYCAPQGIIGVATDGSGKVLFESTDWAANVVAPVPVFIEGGHLYLTTGYGVGSMMLKLEPDGEGFKSKVVWKKGVKDGVACEQQTPIYYEKHLYSLHPADGGANKDQLVCVNPMEPDKILWTSGKGKRFGHYEPFLIADGKIYVLSEAGVLTVVRATPEKYEQLAEFKVLQGRDAWAPIAMAGGRMLLRDSKKMVCLNVAKGIE